jgi:hypothetical protein
MVWLLPGCLALLSCLAGPQWLALLPCLAWLPGFGQVVRRLQWFVCSRLPPCLAGCLACSLRWRVETGRGESRSRRWTGTWRESRSRWTGRARVAKFRSWLTRPWQRGLWVVLLWASARSGTWMVLGISGRMDTSGTVG